MGKKTFEIVLKSVQEKKPNTNYIVYSIYGDLALFVSVTLVSQMVTAAVVRIKHFFFVLLVTVFVVHFRKNALVYFICGRIKYYKTETINSPKYSLPISI